MLNILDDISAQKQLDPTNLYQSITDLAKQCQDAFEKASLVKFTPQPVKNLIMSGMGGSILAAQVIEALYGRELSVPLIKVNDYHLPHWADQNSLVVCSSYSGTTEETVQTLNEAIAKKCQILVICGGGDLETIAKTHHLPMYKIEPVYNPCQQPRMAIGYSLIGQLVMIAKAGLLKITGKDIQLIQAAMAQVVQANQQDIPSSTNPAKKLALEFHTKQVIMAAAEHLSGAFHVVKNQMNENAKQLSHRHDLPELNHHLLEGLRFPKTNQTDVAFWFINSKLYSQRLQTRIQLTIDVVRKNKIKAFEFTPSADTKLVQVFELIQFGSFVNYYLSVLNRLNPALIPWVDYFKKNLQGEPSRLIPVGYSSKSSINPLIRITSDSSVSSTKDL